MFTSEIGSCYSLSNSSIVPVRLLNPHLATPPQVELPVSLVHAESLVSQNETDAKQDCRKVQKWTE